MSKQVKLVLRGEQGRNRARSRKAGHVLGWFVSVHQMGIYSGYLALDKPAWVSR